MSLHSDIQRKAVMFWHVQRVKRLVRERMQLAPHTLISITETPCDDPACPGPATRITILGLDMNRRAVVIHRPVCAVTETELDLISM